MSYHYLYFQSSFDNGLRLFKTTIKGEPTSGLGSSPSPGGGLAAEPELNRAKFEKALKWIAQYIAQHSKNPITIIAVGGVVSLKIVT